MPSHHVIISGTGRAGTTFLMQLLTRLGLETGFGDMTSNIFPNCNAGMERDIREPNPPYILKDPRLCENLDSVLTGGDILIDRAIVPMRDLFSAAESRRDVVRRTDSTLYARPRDVPGGLWDTDQPESQEAILADRVYRLLYALAKHDVPVTLLYFPLFVSDPAYLYEKIKFLLNDMTYDFFFAGFKDVAKPELIHEFQAGPPVGM